MAANSTAESEQTAICFAHSGSLGLGTVALPVIREATVKVMDSWNGRRIVAAAWASMAYDVFVFVSQSSSCFLLMHRMA